MVKKRREGEDQCLCSFGTLKIELMTSRLTNTPSKIKGMMDYILRDFQFSVYKDCSIRFYIDYRKIKEAALPDAYEMTRRDG